MSERLCRRIGETFRCVSLVCRLDEQSPDFEVPDLIIFEYSTKRQTSFFKDLMRFDRRARVGSNLLKRIEYRLAGKAHPFLPLLPLYWPHPMIPFHPVLQAPQSWARLRVAVSQSGMSLSTSAPWAMRGWRLTSCRNMSSCLISRP